MLYVLKKQLTQGSALIITVLLITAISTILFSTARLGVSDIAQVTRLEESLTAHYAAESGIELGLLAYRLNQETETSADATSTEGDYLNFNLQNNSASSVASADNLLAINPSAPSANTKMWWKEERLGVRDEASGLINTIQSPKLFKDQTQQLDLSNLVNQNLTFYWTSAQYIDSSGNEVDYPQVKNPKCTPGESCDPPYVEALFGVEFVLNKIDNQGNVEECDKHISLASGLSIENISYSVEDNKLTWLCQNGLGGEGNKYKLRIKPLIGILDDPLREKDHPYIYYAVSGNSHPIDSGITRINSTGYYGSTKRALQIDINRSSTKLLGLYDLILGALGGGVSGSGQ